MKKNIVLLLTLSITSILLCTGCGGGGGDTETANQAPTADAGPNVTIEVNQTVTIIGSGIDTDGNIQSYQWKEGTSVLADTASFDYNATTVGTHILTLTIIDDDNATDNDTMNVTVTAANTRIQPLIIIRIEFDNYQFTSPASTWSQKIFGTNEGELNHYYNETSYGKFQFEKAVETDGTVNDGIITVHLDEDHPGDIDEFIDRLITAISLANPYIDFSQYNTNNNDAISSNELQIMFLVAGGESATGVTPGIWAHQWCMDGNNADAPTQDDVKLMSCTGNGNYSRFGEKHFYMDSRGHDATIGVIAHELGHAVFGLLDLYDIDESSEGIGNFGLMGAGSWGYKEGDPYPDGLGATPVHMTGWSKVYSGFVTPTVASGDIHLEVNATSSETYTLYKVETGRAGEYFLIENRAASGYDRGLYSLDGTGDFQGGLSILHIDDNLLNNCASNNSCNDDENHKLVDVEEANNPGLDNNNTHRGHYDNLFYSSNQDNFTPTTNPNSDTYNNGSSGVSIISISARGATMSLDLETK